MNFSGSKIKELKHKLLMTLGLLLVYRLASKIPIPGINAKALQSFFESNAGGVFDLINTFNGGALKNFSVIALGIMPYITTSIIFSLLTEVVPRIAELQDDSEGHKTIQRYTRYFTVLLCIIQGYGMLALFEGAKSSTGIPIVADPGWVFRLSTILSLTAGTMFLMWLGERITEFGLENGVSLIIFTGIAVELPGEIAQKVTLFRKDELGLGQLALFFLVIILCFYIVTFIERAFRSIPVQYAKRVVNNQVYGGTQSLPMRVDTGGVMPAILASSVLAFPATISAFISQENFLYKYIETIMSSLNAGNLLYNLLFSFLILYMTYFYAPIQFKTNKISEMLQKNNAFIPGIRPGEKTKAFLDFVLDRLSFFGALFLILICVTPGILISGTTRFGGTALLILVSVSIRVVMNIQAFMFSDKYENAHRSKGKYNGPNRRF